MAASRLRSARGLLAAALLGAACASGSGSGSGPGGGSAADTSQFPSQEQLDQLGATPLPEDAFALEVWPVDSWQLAGPFPERVAVEPWLEPDDPWNALLDDVARSRVGLVVTTEAMHCVARELGLFYLAHRARPTTSLQRFIMGRCNAGVANLDFGWVQGDLPPGTDTAALVGAWRGQVLESMRAQLKGGPRLAGVWFGRENGHAVVMLASARRVLHVEPFRPADAQAGAVEIRGEVLGGAHEVSGLVNQGRLGVATCEPVGDELLPSFHVRCPVAPDDAWAYLTISVFEPNRVLGTPGLHALVWPSGSTTDVYRRPVYGEAWPTYDEEKLDESFVALLNGVRREAELEPLELDSRQSLTATQLAPHFFAAIYGEGDPSRADLIVLGMIAGWGVDGIIQTGHFGAAWAMRTHDLSDLLATALEYPTSREALLASDAKRIAVGPLFANAQGHEAMAAIFGTYALFSEADHDALARRVYEKLDAARAAKGRPPAKRLVDVAWTCQEAASSVEQGTEPADALRYLLRESVDVLHRPVSGWIAEVSDIEEIEFPSEYLQDRSLAVAVSVTHYQPKGEAWGRYVVMLVLAHPPSHSI